MKPNLRNNGLGALNAVRGGALTKIIVFLLVAFAFLALGWMLFLPQLITTQIRKSTGFDAKIDRLAASPMSGNVQIRGFVLTNPPTFPIADFIELGEF